MGAYSLIRQALAGVYQASRLGLFYARILCAFRRGGVLLVYRARAGPVKGCPGPCLG